MSTWPCSPNRGKVAKMGGHAKNFRRGHTRHLRAFRSAADVRPESNVFERSRKHGCGAAASLRICPGPMSDQQPGNSSTLLGLSPACSLPRSFMVLFFGTCAPTVPDPASSFQSCTLSLLALCTGTSPDHCLGGRRSEQTVMILRFRFACDFCHFLESPQNLAG
jgi:hypothetical protein